MPYHIEKLLKFLRHHDVVCHYTANNKLMVEDCYSWRPSGAADLIDGPYRVQRDWIEIPATPSAVREFLGY